MKRTHFLFDTDKVQVIKPNFDGVDGKSVTYTIVLKNGKSFSFPCTGPEDFENFETKVKAHAEYKNFKKK